MKKTLIALTMTAFAATSANAFTLYKDDSTNISLYSSVRILLAKMENNRPDLLNDGSRFWFNANQKFGDDWSAFGAAQLRPSTQYDDNFSSGFYTHRLYAGIKHKDIGQISFGNQSTMGNKFKVAGVAEKFGAITRAGVKNPGTETYRTYGRTQYGLNTSGKKVIHIESVSINGFTFGADYSFARNGSERSKYNKHTEKVEKNRRNDEWQVGILHYKRIGDLRLNTNVVYGDQRRVTNSIKHMRSIAAGFGIGYKAFNLGIDYIHDKNFYHTGGKTNSQTSLQIGTKYYITYPWDVYAAYRQTKYTDNVKNKGFAVGTHYRITKRVKGFLEYATNKASNLTDRNVKYYGENIVDRQNGYYAGFRVDF